MYVAPAQIKGQELLECCLMEKGTVWYDEVLAQVEVRAMDSEINLYI